MDLIELTGLVGAATYFLAYFLLQAGVLQARSWSHCLLNILAPILVLISLAEDFNLAATAIQLIWLAISLGGVYRLVYMQLVGQKKLRQKQLLIDRINRPHCR